MEMLGFKGAWDGLTGYLEGRGLFVHDAHGCEYRNIGRGWWKKRWKRANGETTHFYGMFS